jgi:multidrug efflux pump subunit AcrB
MNPPEEKPSSKIGISGRLAGAFIHSKLTPLLMVAALLLGMAAILLTPREEEPQIVVPMADVFIPLPGSAPKEVEELLVRPVERKLAELPGVEYVYSIAKKGTAFFIVRFYVGEDFEKSLVDLYDKLMSNRDIFPPGAGDFTVKPRDINDVPVVTLTLWSGRYDGLALRRVADHLLEELKKIPDASGGFIVGGSKREVRVEPDPSRMKSHGVVPADLDRAIRTANRRLPSGSFERTDREIPVETGGFLGSREDVEDLVVGSAGGRPVFLRDVASVSDAAEEPDQYVWFGLGAGAESARPGQGTNAEYPAVTVALAKQRGTNAVNFSRAVLARVDALRGPLIPSDVHVTVTRDYGRTADEKANELLKHLLYAVVAVVVFLGLALGIREAGVVSIAIPLTLALTLFVSMMIGYTINRVTLFALIFSIGILVDDAIVVVENIYRHLRLTKIPHPDTAIRAVDEVGNPTILATFTVIAALLPMAFISGLMGPYMRPIPVNASLAMFFSLLVAFIVVPWFCRICTRKHPSEGMPDVEEKATVLGLYRRLLTPLLESRTKRTVFLAGVAVLLIASLSLFYFKLTIVKMLPFDNKSELQVVIDMPEGTALEETAKVTRALTDYVKTIPEATDYQAYVGTASPFNFNGLVRHYFLRDSQNVADIQVNLLEKHRRASQSHAIAKRIRPAIQAIAKDYKANVKIVEVPPGPPVQSVLVAEVYGPDDAARTRLAKRVRSVFENTKGVTDVDDSIEADQDRVRFEVDRVKAARSGISPGSVVDTVGLALGGETVGFLHLPDEKTPVRILIRLPRPLRSGTEALEQLALRNPSGGMISLSELVRAHREAEEKSIYHKNQKAVVYVTGDVTGREESPVYGILNIGRGLDQTDSAKPVAQYFAAQPASEEAPAIKWDGEWQITYETFRDMGIAFAAALVLI